MDRTSWDRIVSSARAVLAYGWWTVATIPLYVGAGLVMAGIALAVFAFLSFRHARKVTVAPSAATARPRVEVG